MTDTRRVRRVRVGNDPSVDNRLTGRRKDTSSPIIEEVPVEETPIVGGQRASRVDRVLGDYPNMDINPITRIMERMGIGETVTFVTTKYSENEWRTLAGENVPRITNKNAFEGKLPRNFEKKVILSAKFVEWSKEWNKKSFEEKKAFAVEHGIAWDSDHPKEGVQKINLGYAVRCYLRIQKYKPEYSTSAARKQARDNAKVIPKK